MTDTKLMTDHMPPRPTSSRFFRTFMRSIFMTTTCAGGSEELVHPATVPRKDFLSSFLCRNLKRHFSLIVLIPRLSYHSLSIPSSFACERVSICSAFRWTGILPFPVKLLGTALYACLVRYEKNVQINIYTPMHPSVCQDQSVSLAGPGGSFVFPRSSFTPTGLYKYLCNTIAG